ncbi:DUF2975 domain-containing protein [Pseudonocardia sp.]|uniref:DUF2975 domain-containing protein n=1 Tax=Pseudonocardia sp. TaxID=60912 RepID=UPI00262F5D71|nr:DUF2975 domain-containing protein [Pseudonocardia sp.]
MLTTHRAVLPLRVLLVLLFTVVTAGQLAVLGLVLPRMSELTAGDPPEVASLDWTSMILAVLGLLCVQVVIVCTGRLLTMVARDRIFSAASLPWVDAIVWAMAVAWVLLLGALVPVFAVAELEDAPGLAALHLLLLLVGAAVGLLMVVMRALLRQATTLRADMEAVI